MRDVGRRGETGRDLFRDGMGNSYHVGDAVIIDGDKAWIIRTLGGDRCAVDYHDGNTSYEEVGSEEMHRA